jgi:hypothetical protein
MSYNTGARIVTNGLVMYLDAANSKSIVSGSNSWVDLSRNNNTGSLINGPTFSSANGGSILFDGTDDYVSCPIPSTSITNITMTGFVNVVLNRKGAYFRNGGGGNGYAIGIGNTDFDGNGNNMVALFPGIRWLATTTAYTAGWQMVTFILNSSSVASGYINTTPITFPAGNNPVAPTSNLYLGRNVGDEPLGARAANCNIANFMFYNRVLSAAEVLQNYNATKKRFGL